LKWGDVGRESCLIVVLILTLIEDLFYSYVLYKTYFLLFKNNDLNGYFHIVILFFPYQEKNQRLLGKFFVMRNIKTSCEIRKRCKKTKNDHERSHQQREGLKKDVSNPEMQMTLNQDMKEVRHKSKKTSLKIGNNPYRKMRKQLGMGLFLQ